MAQSNFVMTEAIKPVQKDICRGHRHEAAEDNFTGIIDYNGKSNFDEEVEFVDIDLSCNKLNL